MKTCTARESTSVVHTCEADPSKALPCAFIQIEEVQMSI